MATRRGVLSLSVLVLVFLVWSVPRANGYFVSVDAHAEECFFDRVSSGMKMSLTFEVVEGGFLDIDVKVRRARLLYGWERPVLSSAWSLG